MRIASAFILGAVLCAGCSPPNSESQSIDNPSVNDLVASDRTSPDVAHSNASANEAEMPQSSSSAPSASPGLPSFDTVSYCREIGDTAGGSMQIEATCREMEAQALSELRGMDIPSRMLNYCTEIGETAGESYQIMKTCVEMESEASTKL